MRKIISVPEEKRWDYRELLMLADPEEQAISRYLMESDMYVLQEDEMVVSEAVVRMESGGRCELMNLATREDMQGKGRASWLVRKLMERYSETCSEMLVGTSEDGRAFYRRLGFQDAFIRQRFFVDHYGEPIIENGRQCVDMYCLRIGLKGKE